VRPMCGRMRRTSLILTTRMRRNRAHHFERRDDLDYVWQEPEYGAGERCDVPAGAVHSAEMGPAGCRYLIGER